MSLGRIVSEMFVRDLKGGDPRSRAQVSPRVINWGIIHTNRLQPRSQKRFIEKKKKA